MIHFQQLLQVLPSNIEQMAINCNAFQRARKIKSPLELFKLLMLYCGLDLSLRACAGKFTETYSAISDEAVKKRLISCTDWIKSLLKETLTTDHNHTEGDLKFIAVDGSTVQEPGATQTSYRLHLGIDLMDLTLTDAVVTTDKVGEKLQHYQLREGYVFVADRGYSRVQTIMPTVDQGADVIVRYTPNSMPLYTFNSNNQKLKIDWHQQLISRSEKNQVIECYMILGDKSIKVYVHAIAKNTKVAENERREMMTFAKKNGRKVRAQTLYLTNWMLVFTTIPPQVLSTLQVQNIYKARWQIELYIKRLKRLLNIDLLRAKKDGKLAEVYLLGKLLYAVLVEKIYKQHYFNHGVSLLDKNRNLSPWRLIQDLNDQIKYSLLAEYPSFEANLASSIKSMSERPRKRKLQRFTDDISMLFRRHQSV